MCHVCDKAKKLPVGEALVFIAGSVRKNGYPKCVDLLVGELAGVKEPEVDLAAESAYERRRRGL